MKRTFFFSVFAYLSCTLLGQGNADVIEDALSSVVTVAVYKSDYTKKTFGFRGAAEAYVRSLDLGNALSSGSGFVIEEGGKMYVVTNSHVVESAKDEEEAIYVFSINQTRYEVRVKGGDSFYDFALLEFVTPPGKEVKATRFATDDPRIGEQVFAIGNPLGEYPYTVSDGIISARNRVRGGPTGMFGFLQSTATVIWGNSGGPLINTRGEVVGVNSQIAFAETMGTPLWQPQINFALEASICRRLTDDILNNNGRIRRAYIGIELSQKYTRQVDPHSGQQQYRLDDPLPVITDVMPDAPSLNVLRYKTGHSIVAVNGFEVRNISEALGEFEKVKPGEKITLMLMKDNKVETITIQTATLQPGFLESLANHILAKDPSIQLVEAGDAVSIRFRPAYASVSKQAHPEHASREYVVLGLGHVSGRNSDLWRINTLGDLGTAMRFCSLYGMFDLVTREKNNPHAQPEVNRIFFSGNQEVIKSTLWY